MNATITIMTKLNEIFAPMDAKVITSTKEWAKGRNQAISDYWSSEECKALRGNPTSRYEKLYSIAGGKSWYDVLYGNSDEGIDEFVIKNCETINKKRNAKIAAKLEKLGIKDVVSEEFSHTNNGFNGVFVINTDNGKKRVMIETILAGGYNVQCLHLRVLVKVK